MKKDKKLADIFSKKTRKSWTPQIMVTWQSPKADKVSKIVLMVNGIWGGVVPSSLIVKTFLKKRQIQSIWFFTGVNKILLENFLNNFQNFISSRGLSRDNYWREGIQEIHDFRGFGGKSRRVFIFLRKIFLVARSYLVVAINTKYQNFDYGCFSYTGNEAQSPDFARFWGVGYFGSCFFWHKPLA